MKKNILLFTVLVMFFCTSFAADKPKNITPQERLDQIEKRVYEIWNSDFQQFETEEQESVRSELKELRKEIKEIKGLDDKVSISIGAIIIILLVLIIIT